MKTLITGDLHLAENPRDEYRLQWFEILPELAREHEADRVIIVGDITEVKDAHRARLVNRIVDGFKALADVSHVYVLKGNHDYLAEDVPFFRFLQHLPRVRWINEPTRIKLRGLGACLFLPHARSPEDWGDHLRDSYDYFFCHQTFNGARLDNGRAAEGGAFSPDLFHGEGFRVISGDVHAPQKVGPIIYVGAPYAVDFGDDYAPRVLLLEGKAMRSIPARGPQKRLIEAESMAGLMAREGEVRRGDIIKVRAVLEEGESSRAVARQRIREWADHVGAHLAVLQVVAPDAPASASKARAPLRADDELVRAHAKKMGKGKATIAAGIKIMEEVR